MNLSQRSFYLRASEIAMLAYDNNIEPPIHWSNLMMDVNYSANVLGWFDDVVSNCQNMQFI